LAPGITVRPEALVFSAVRSGGPGGQHVNTTASQVQLRVPLAALAGLDAAAQARLRRFAAHLLTESDELVIAADEARSQASNKSAALARLVALVSKAAVRPKMRKPTAPTRGSQVRRLASKSRDGARKAARRDHGDGED
jgi:ribosome-associated protein